jgi:hypothetical protein
LARAFAFAAGTTNIWGHPLTRQADGLPNLFPAFRPDFLLA